MSASSAVLFVDRDGTLIEEPPDEQVDAIEKIRFMPEVFDALRAARKPRSRTPATRPGWESAWCISTSRWSTT